jgi:siroheme synthase
VEFHFCPIFTVLLVGVGPGDPDLLTVKASRAISSADVIVFDKLVSDSILELVLKTIECIFAGKPPKSQHIP